MTEQMLFANSLCDAGYFPSFVFGPKVNTLHKNSSYLNAKTKDVITSVKQKYTGDHLAK